MSLRLNSVRFRPARSYRKPTKIMRGIADMRSSFVVGDGEHPLHGRPGSCLAGASLRPCISACVRDSHLSLVTQLLSTSRVCVRHRTEQLLKTSTNHVWKLHNTF